MNFLVTNDDGIDAVGIRKLVDAVSKVGNVYVCAPHTQRSACGHGITIKHPVTATEIEYEKAEIAFSMEGTPADCVKIGLEILARRDVKIDMVFSGINLGGNMGTDVLYSGTVSAAVEGALCGKPSVAVSVNALNPSEYGVAMKLAENAAKMDYGSFDKEMILNINVPDLPEKDIRGVKVMPLGVREYDEWFEELDTGNNSKGYKYSGRPAFDEELSADTSDVGAEQHGYATITPLHYDLTRYDLLNKLKETGVTEI